jgi:hypothetical protein
VFIGALLHDKDGVGQMTKFEVYSVSIDEVPDLVTRANSHEVCDPGRLTAEEIVHMWSVLKQAYVQARAALNEIRLGIILNRDTREELLVRAEEALAWKQPRPTVTIFACASPHCTSTEHQWDGPVVQRGHTGSVSCSKCGALAFDVDNFMGGA